MKAIVLSSGGVDSTTCLALAVSKYSKDNVVSVSVYYGQRHDKELVCARKIADYFGIEHYELDFTSIFNLSNCSLLKSSNSEVKHGDYEEQIKNSKDGIVSTYVPFRNGLLISAMASFGMSLFNNEEFEVYLGAHADDSAGNAYADCSVEFCDTMYKAIELGTYNKVKVVAPFKSITKAEVVKIGLALKVPYELTWSCYEGGDKPCGKCGTCIDRARAFEINNVIDPAL